MTIFECVVASIKFDAESDFALKNSDANSLSSDYSPEL